MRRQQPTAREKKMAFDTLLRPFNCSIVTGHMQTLSQLPPALRKNIENWRKYNHPACHLHYLTNNQQHAFVERKCHRGPPGLCDVYSRLAPSSRAEVFSYLWLYERGGWWVDADVPASNLSSKCKLSPPLATLGTRRMMTAVREPRENRPRHSILAAHHQYHPIMYRVLERIVANVLSPALVSTALMYVTGPHNLHRAICDLMPSYDRAKYCGDRRPKAPPRWEGTATHFGGVGDTPVGRTYLVSNQSAGFRYVACNVPHHMKSYNKAMFKRMGFEHHLDEAQAGGAIKPSHAKLQTSG